MPRLQGNFTKYILKRLRTSYVIRSG